MKKQIIASITFFLTFTSCAFSAELSSGDNKVTIGKGSALFEKASAEGQSCSDNTCPEPAAKFDLSKNNADELTKKVSSLNADAPCTVTRDKLKFGSERIIIENGLVKMVIIPEFGGRIIEISDKATGQNIFMDKLQNADTRPEAGGKRKDQPPYLLGGYLEGVDNGNKTYWNTVHKIEITKESKDEITLKTTGEVKNSSWGVKGTVTVERTITLRKGSSFIAMDVTLTNHSGDKQREMRYRPQSRHALGGKADDDEFWLCSTGYVVNVPPNHKGDCFNALRVEEKIDTWQAIIDRKTRNGVVIIPHGEIAGRQCIYSTTDKNSGEKWYTYENTSTKREHVVEGVKISVSQNFAPVLNFDAITFANDKVAVAFLPSKRRFVSEEKIEVLIAAAAIDKSATGTVTLTPTFINNGVTVGTCKPISIDARLLVAAPNMIQLEIPAGLPTGESNMIVKVSGSGGEGSFKFRIFVPGNKGSFLSLVNPEDDGYGKGMSVTGKKLNTKVTINSVNGSNISGAYKTNNIKLPFSTVITPSAGGFKVEHEVDFSSLPESFMIENFGMRFPIISGLGASPIVVGAHRRQLLAQRQTYVTIGSDNRDEQYLVDQSRGSGEQKSYNQKAIPSWALSDNADRYPVWRIGGVLQKNQTTSFIYKTAGYDVAPTIVVQKKKSAGWIDTYSHLTKTGALVYMPNMEKNAPKEIVYDGDTGELIVYFLPKHAPALSLKKAGKTGKSRAEMWGLQPDRKAKFTFFIYFHTNDMVGGYLPNAGNIATKIRAKVEEFTK